VQVLNLPREEMVAFVDEAAVVAKRLDIVSVQEQMLLNIMHRCGPLTLGPAGPSRTAQTEVPQMRQWEQRHAMRSCSLKDPRPPPP
jgi:hypothetical protein